MTSIPLAYPVNILTSITVTGAGEAFALPTKASYLAWQASFNTPPAAVNITLQLSIDGINWFIVDTTTLVGGEVRTVGPTAAIFVRVNVVTNTGGSQATVLLVAKATG